MTRSKWRGRRHGRRRREVLAHSSGCEGPGTEDSVTNSRGQFKTVRHGLLSQEAETADSQQEANTEAGMLLKPQEKKAAKSVSMSQTQKRNLEAEVGCMVCIAEIYDTALPR